MNHDDHWTYVSSYSYDWSYMYKAAIIPKHVCIKLQWSLIMYISIYSDHLSCMYKATVITYPFCITDHVCVKLKRSLIRSCMYHTTVILAWKVNLAQVDLSWTPSDSNDTANLVFLSGCVFMILPVIIWHGTASDGRFLVFCHLQLCDLHYIPTYHC